MLDDKSNARLLPCPFCGGQPSIYDKSDEHGPWRYITHLCGWGGLGMDTRTKEHTREAAVAAWNRRFVPSSIEPTTFDLKDTLHKVVNNLLEHGGEHYKRMFGRSGSCIFTNAEVGAIREVVFRALKAKLSPQAFVCRGAGEEGLRCTKPCDSPECKP